MNQDINQQYIQKLEEIKKNIKTIKGLIKDKKRTYFVELIGTPKSGKTTLINKIKNLFDNEKLPVVARQETAEYNPISKEAERLWMLDAYGAI